MVGCYTTDALFSVHQVYSLTADILNIWSKCEWL